MFTSLSRQTLYNTWKADIIAQLTQVWFWVSWSRTAVKTRRWNVKYPHALLVFSLFLIIDSIIMLDKAATNKTHELLRAENPFALWMNTIHGKQRQTNRMRAKRHTTTCHSLQTSTSVTSLVRKFSESSPKLRVTLLWCFKKLILEFCFLFILFVQSVCTLCGFA